MDKYYVVKKGNKPGIYTSWLECKQSVDGCKGAIYKKFVSLIDAQAFYNSDNTHAHAHAQVSVNNIPIINNYNKQINNEQVNNKQFNNKQFNNNNNNNNTTKLNIVSDDDLTKINIMSKNIQSSTYSDTINYNVKCWTCIDNNIYIFTDGSSRNIHKKKNNYNIHEINLNNNDFNSGIGVYVGYECINIKEQYINKTNNQCELLAIDYAFTLIIRYYRELLDMCKTINIVSDSEYSIKACTIWLSQWKKNNWKTCAGNDVKNKEIIEHIDNSITRIKVINNNIESANKLIIKLIHVNSHQQPDTQDNFKFNVWFGNYIADALAQNKI